MEIEFDKSFLKSISKLSENKIKHKIELAIFEIERMNDLSEITNCKKLKGF